MPETELPPGSGFAYDLGERILASQSAQVDAIDIVRRAGQSGASSRLSQQIASRSRNSELSSKLLKISFFLRRNRVHLDASTSITELEVARNHDDRTPNQPDEDARHPLSGDHARHDPARRSRRQTGCCSELLGRLVFGQGPGSDRMRRRRVHRCVEASARNLLPRGTALVAHLPSRLGPSPRILGKQLPGQVPGPTGHGIPTDWSGELERKLRVDQDDLLEGPMHPSAMDRSTRHRKHRLALLADVTKMHSESRVRIATRLLTIAFVVGLIPTVATTPAHGWAPITATETVNVRVAPNLSGGVIGQLSPGLVVPIRCAIAGQLIYDTNVWFYAEFPTGTYGFFSAYYSTAEYYTWADLEDRYGIQRCERPSTVGGGSVYYQPRYSVGDPIAPDTTYTATKDVWSPPRWYGFFPSCDTGHAAYWPEYFDGRKIQRASGWSLGRLGLTYLLQDHPGRAANLNEIILFDPGSLDDYENTCDQRYDQDQLYADWLSGDSTRRLLVLAGAVTRDVDTAVINSAGVTEYHQGIQRHLFPAIRSAGVAHQVLVCNYDTMEHLEVMEQFGWLARSGDVTTCPAQPNDHWHP